jgi:hypothetical protein
VIKDCYTQTWTAFQRSNKEIARLRRELELAHAPPAVERRECATQTVQAPSPLPKQAVDLLQRYRDRVTEVAALQDRLAGLLSAGGGADPMWSGVVELLKWNGLLQEELIGRCRDEGVVWEEYMSLRRRWADASFEPGDDAVSRLEELAQRCPGESEYIRHLLESLRPRLARVQEWERQNQFTQCRLEAMAKQKERIDTLEREKRVLMKERDAARQQIVVQIRRIRDANEERFTRIRNLHTQEISVLVEAYENARTP